ncbi:hypothetical protein [Pantoea sp. JV6]|uniref:hypothetical protein n=1 Tax=Pantoea sp. JV6 TaxID=2981604 RepID=UPI00221E8A09|nr:hypothetical protein [Pantoea sp. JV6]MCW0974353.1 hypothetical protein [Pantoea sp. JV6]
MIDFSSILEEHSNKPVVSGEWFTIQWTPDIASGEKLNIGVAFYEASGESFVQVLDYYERIKCLYSQSAVYHLSLACEVAKEIALTKQIKNVTDFCGVNFVSNGYAQGDSADDIISTIFSNIVPLAVRQEKNREKAYYPVSRERLYTIINSQLKVRLDYDEYFNMVEPTAIKRVNLGNQTQTLFLPYKAKNSIATIASAAYADENTAKCHLYDAQRDVSLAVNNFNEFDSGAIFILSPSSELKIEKRDQVDSEIDKFCWYLKTQSIYTQVDSDAESLADKAVSWYRKKVA